MDEKSSLPTAIQPSMSRAKVVSYVAIAVIGGAIDLWTKSAVFAWRGMPGQRDPWWLVDGYVGIETAINLGAVFGVGQGRGHVFAALSIVAAIGILLWLFRYGAIHSWWLTVALGCVSAGIIGNLYDRLGLWWDDRFFRLGFTDAFKSGVRDWILFQASDRWKWPNFNIADSLLVVGAAMMMYQSLFPDPQTAPTSQESKSDHVQDT
jgi:signal peptidase II